jgi:hypothetical protein
VPSEVRTAEKGEGWRERERERAPCERDAVLEEEEVAKDAREGGT